MEVFTGTFCACSSAPPTAAQPHLLRLPRAARRLTEIPSSLAWTRAEAKAPRLAGRGPAPTWTADASARLLPICISWSVPASSAAIAPVAIARDLARSGVKAEARLDVAW